MFYLWKKARAEMGRITVWNDQTSDRHAWIVDREDEHGTGTLSTWKTRAEAIAAATKASGEQKVVEIDQFGNESEV